MAITSHSSSATPRSPGGVGTNRRDGVKPGLHGVPETMLWALHGRATEASRPDTILIDPDCLRIHAALDYDFEGHFGHPMGSLASRAAEIDRVTRRWIAQHPRGEVISLGEGLETQSRRVDNGEVRWLTVDLPEAIRLRERFIPVTRRHRHLAVSALDPAWMNAVDPSSGVFIIAQGLLMYFNPESVRELLRGIAERFPGAEFVFDVVPRWFSQLTLLGLRQTRYFQLPPMPWGINRDEIGPTLQWWHPRFGEVEFLGYRVPRGLPLLFTHMIDRIPVIRNEVPSLVRVSVAPQPVQTEAFSDTRRRKKNRRKAVALTRRKRA